MRSLSILCVECLCVAWATAAPGVTAGPQLFGPGVISTIDDEAGGALTPDGKEFYFVKFAPYTVTPTLSLICVSHKRNTGWSEPEVVPFSGQYVDLPPRLSADGKMMLFGSTRPVPGTDGSTFHVWRVVRIGSAWSAPEPLPSPIDTPGVNNFDASIAADGTLYLTSDGGHPGEYHIYSSRLVGSQYSKPEKLPTPVNSGADTIDVEPFIASDQSYLIFVSQWKGQDPRNRRPEELIAGGSPYPRGDIYITFRRPSGWTLPSHLGNHINSFAAESFPSVTPDGKYLFFSSERSIFNAPLPKPIRWARLELECHTALNGRGNIFRIEMAAVMRARFASKRR